MINRIKNQKKYLYFFIGSILIIVIAGILSPIISNSLKTNKNKEFEEKISSLQVETQSLITKTESRLFNELKKIGNIVESTKLSDKNEKEKLFDFVTKKEFTDIGVGIYDSTGHLIVWNNNHSITDSQLRTVLNSKDNEESFFYNTSLKSYLALFSLRKNCSIFLSIPLEKHYKLRNEYFEPLSLSKKLSDQYNADLRIVYRKKELFAEQTPPKFTFDITNKHGNKIGYAVIEKINVNESIEKFESSMFVFQSLFTFLAFIFLGLWIFPFLARIKHKSIQIVLISFYIILFRVIIFFLDISSKLGITELSNPIYFSSIFGYGIVKSPIELFLTVISLIIILIIVYKSIVSMGVETSEKKSNTFIGIAQILILSGLLFSVLRIFGATIKSVVFDSTILYFKNTTLFSDLPTTFMYFNVLLIGTGFVLLSIIFVLLLLKTLDRTFTKDKIQKFLILIVVLEIVGVIFDLIQPNPQTSWFIRTLFVLIAAIISYYIAFTKTSKYSILLAVLFSGSFLSISLLSYFNSDLEKRSLKTIAAEMSRSSISLLEYYADDIVHSVMNDNSIKQKFLDKNTNYNSEAFVIWSNSSLSRDSKSSIINIIAPDKTLLGSFNYEFDEPFIWDWNDDKSDLQGVQKVYQNIEGTENQVIRAITPIKLGQKLLGYIEVSLLYDVYGFGFDENEKFLSSSSPISKISVNRDLLKIFEFRNGELVNYYTDALISEPEMEKLLNTKFNQSNEAWVNIRINREGHTFYLSRRKHKNVEEIIAVGLRNKDVAWNLYDFFKVLFIHSLMIVLILLVITLKNFPKKSDFKISFKTKILLTLLVVSILPLILLATYFKEITEEKNSAAVYYKLGKRADNVSQFLGNYFNNSTLTETAIFEKAVNDLGVHFSIYENIDLLYSSEGIYYKIGLLSKILNADVNLNLFYKGEKEYVVQEAIEKYTFNSFYYKTILGDKTYVIKVSDAFNRIQLPMTGTELNVFLFGTYSLAIILIILLSTLLANQISSPIEKLTKATKSVGRGDMDIQLQSFGKGEIGELIDGFNRMVRELKKNQIELAEVERESAWKEMAKQVAHEIKNPLTPMKLAVQHLISAYKDKSDKFDEIFNKVTSTVITQIDNLTNIASEFSSFAKMPTIKLLDIELVGILKETVDLFIEEDCKVSILTDLGKVIVKSDREQFQRMMINLIRNSIQAEAEHVWITLARMDAAVEIRVKDDGKGIPEEIKTKIFDENYTTKKEGMGLGLALAKRFLDITNGTIFISETSPEGTEILIRIAQS